MIYLIRMLAYLFVRIVIAIRFGVKTLANGKISADRMLDRRVGHVVWVIMPTVYSSSTVVRDDVSNPSSAFQTLAK